MHTYLSDTYDGSTDHGFEYRNNYAYLSYTYSKSCFIHLYESSLWNTFESTFEVLSYESTLLHQPSKVFYESTEVRYESIYESTSVRKYESTYLATTFVLYLFRTFEDNATYESTFVQDSVLYVATYLRTKELSYDTFVRT